MRARVTQRKINVEHTQNLICNTNAGLLFKEEQT